MVPSCSSISLGNLLPGTLDILISSGQFGGLFLAPSGGSCPTSDCGSKVQLSSVGATLRLVPQGPHLAARQCALPWTQTGYCAVQAAHLMTPGPLHPLVGPPQHFLSLAVFLQGSQPQPLELVLGPGLSSASWEAWGSPGSPGQPQSLLQWGCQQIYFEQNPKFPDHFGVLVLIYFRLN